jgi:hypothetical protein
MGHSDKDLDQAAQWIDYWNDIFASNPEAAKNAELSFCPPEPSSDEQPAAEDPEFLANCRADVISMMNGPVVWEGQLLTRSPKWGLVWRADFWDPKNSAQLYPSRITCWKNDKGELGMTVSGCQHDKLELKR